MPRARPCPTPSEWLFSEPPEVMHTKAPLGPCSGSYRDYIGFRVQDLGFWI